MSPNRTLRQVIHFEGVRRFGEAQAEQARRAGAAFAERFPTFERTEANALKICRHMADHDLDPKQVSSYVTAFTALVDAGQMEPAPVLSADEYLAANADTLVDKRVPPLIQARHAKAENTQRLFDQAQAATAEGTTVPRDGLPRR